jgi:hypothetical protein
MISVERCELCAGLWLPVFGAALRLIRTCVSVRVETEGDPAGREETGDIAGVVAVHRILLHSTAHAVEASIRFPPIN